MGHWPFLYPVFQTLFLTSPDGRGGVTIHKPSFFLSLNASVYTFQTQVCTQNRLSSLCSKKAEADTQVWMALHPPLPHLHPRSCLHNTQTPILRLPFEVETPSTFPVNPTDFLGLIPVLLCRGERVTPQRWSPAAQTLLDQRNRSWVWFQLGCG